MNISAQQFKARLAGASTEGEVQQLHHAFFPHVQGTVNELLECLAFADDRMADLADHPPVRRGGPIVMSEELPVAA